MKCTHCGLIGFGKCPKCRTVFTEKYEYQQTETERDCNHVWESKDACIYGCGYKPAN